MANLDTPLKRLSAVDVAMPYRGCRIWPADTGFSVGNRQSAATMYGGVTTLTYGRGIAAPSLTNGAQASKRI